MILENKLGIASDVELAREEERLTKLRALELYDTGLLGTFEVGTFDGLAKIHGHLFQDVYECWRAAHGEHLQGQLSLCVRDVSGLGPQGNRQDAPIHV